MCTQRQHVGDTVTKNLPEVVCAILRRQCNGDKPLPGPVCDRGELIIDGIIYNVGSGALIGIRVLSDWIPLPADGNTKHTVFLDLFIDQIVKTFEAAINCDKNRYQLGTGLYCREFANSAEFYQAGVHGRTDFPHLRVGVRFNGKTDEGQFDCLGSQTSVWNTLGEDRIKEVAAAGGHSVRASVRCSNDGRVVPGYPSGQCKYGPAVKPFDLTCKLDPNCLYT